MKRLLLISTFFAFLDGYAQTVNTSTVNAGGGTFETGNFQVDWSIGEGSSIATFQDQNNLVLTSGVLQPYTGKTETVNFLNFTWLKDEIALFPVPTRTTLEVDVKIAASGLLTIELMDRSGKLVITRSVPYNQVNRLHKLDLAGMVSGSYYINITLHTADGNSVIRKGAFQVQKL